MIKFQPKEGKPVIAAGCILKLPKMKKAYFKTHSHEQIPFQMNEAHLREN